jgi:hypothetical protein
LWATAVRTARGAPAARLWLEAKAAHLDPHLLARGDWARGRYSVLLKHEKRPVEMNFWVKLLQSNPDTGRTLLYLTEAASLHTHPPAFGRALARRDIRTPPEADFASLRKGWMSRETFVEAVQLETIMVSRLCDWLAQRFDWDLAVVRLEALRKLGRALWVSPHRRDLRAKERKRSRGLFERALQTFDRRLAAILDGLHRDQTTVIVVGTGGLAPLRAEVRLGSMLAEMAPFSRAVADGGTAFVYLDPHERAQGAADALRRRLQALRYRGRRVFGPPGRVLTAPRMPAALRRPESGDLFVQAALGFALSTRRGKRIFYSPRRAAADGYAPQTNVATGVLFVRSQKKPDKGVDLSSSGRSEKRRACPPHCVAWRIRRALSLPVGSPPAPKNCPVLF